MTGERRATSTSGRPSAAALMVRLSRKPKFAPAGEVIESVSDFRLAEVAGPVFMARVCCSRSMASGNWKRPRGTRPPGALPWITCSGMA